MGSITFNDQTVNVLSVAYYNSSSGTWTKRGSTNNVYNVDLFPNTVTVGDFIVFAGNWRNKGGKFNKLNLNIDVGIAGTGVTGVWEYINGGTNATPTWAALSVISDGTNGLTTTGANTLEFTVPNDWNNYHYTGITAYAIYYTWNIRYRITGFTTFTEGGHLANVSNSNTTNSYTIFVSGYSSSTPVTMADIYAADVAGGWGLVQNCNDAYIFDCNLYFDNDNYFESISEYIQFNLNWVINTEYSSVFLLGEITVGSKTQKGTMFKFIGQDTNCPSNLFGSGSRVYGSSIIHKFLSGSVGSNGYWGASVGNYPDQIVYDFYCEGLRQITLSYNANVMIGIRCAAIDGRTSQCESPGAVVQNCTLYGGDYGWRPGVSTGHDYLYIHECDVSDNTYPANPYQTTNFDHSDFYMVNCYWGAVADENKSYWRIGSSSGAGPHNVNEAYSVTIQVLDVKGNPIQNARVKLTNTDDDEIFNVLTNADGYAGLDSGTITAVTSSYIQDSSKSWSTDEWWWQYCLITSGDGIGQRRIIKKGNTSTQLDMHFDFVTTPSTNDRFVIIPIATSKVMNPAAYTANTWQKSTATSKNPFTLTITKNGYKDYESTFDLTQEFNEKITLKQTNNLVDDEGGFYLANDTDAGLIKDDGKFVLEL